MKIIPLATDTMYYRAFSRTSLFLSTCITLLLFGYQVEAQQIITSIDDGKWENPATWDLGVPTSSDTVVIDCHNIEIDKVTGNVSIKRLELNNSSNNGGGATLIIKDTVSVIVADSLIATAANIDEPVEIELLNTTSLQANNIYIHRLSSNTIANKLTLYIEDEATLQVDNNLQYDYMGSGSEGTVDIKFINTSEINVGNDLILNHVGGDDMTLTTDHSIIVNVDGNVYLNQNGGNQFIFEVKGSSSINIGGNLSAINDGGGLNDIFAEFVSSATLNIDGDLILESLNDSDLVNFEFNGSSLDTINDLRIAAVSEGDVLISLKSNSVLAIRDSIIREGGYGSLAMESNSTIAYVGNSAQVLAQNSGTGTDGFLFTNIAVNNSGSSNLSLEGPVTITEHLSLINGIINTDSINIIIIDNATSDAGNSTSFINGPLRKLNGGDFIFPVGSGAIHAPIEISSPGSSGDFTAQYFTGPYDNIDSLGINVEHVSSLEYWELDRAAGDDVYITLHWNNAARSEIDSLPSLIVTHYKNDIWENEGAGVITGDTGQGVSGSIRTLDKVSSFSPFTFGSISKANPLPVELLYFEASVLNKSVALKWITASEINNDYFTIERSINGIDWEYVTEVDGAGYSVIPIEYSAVDNNPYKGVSYYRLIQTDFNEQIDISDIKTVIIADTRKSPIKIFPNPTTGPITIVTDPTEFEIISLYNVDGQEVTKLTNIEQRSDSSYNIDLSKLPSGVFTIKTKTMSSKILKE